MSMNPHEKRALRTLLGKLCKDRMAEPDSQCGDGACDECPIQGAMNLLPDEDGGEPAPMTAERAKQIAFQALQLIRIKREETGHDPNDTDDWLFSELDVERGELAEIFKPYGVLYYAGSCFPDGESPKDYDRKHFSGRQEARP